MNWQKQPIDSVGKDEAVSIKIDGLFEVQSIDILTELFLDAFQNYPKLMFAFQQSECRRTALEATIRYYCAYDLKYGKAYALDQKVREAVVIVESNQMKYNFLRHFVAGSYSKEYRKAMNRLTREEKKKRILLFQEIDRLETTIELPKEHLYIDFLGVKTEMQGQGRGRRLMEYICHYSDQRKLPLMLFTNTDMDVKFYHGLGFHLAGETQSMQFGFTNWYMVRMPMT